MKNPICILGALTALVATCQAAATIPATSLTGPPLSPRTSPGPAAICNPPIPAPNVPRPPCAHIEYIETMCWPKGGDPIHYDAHAQCLCNGSFFPEWHGCQQCLFLHGLRSERESAFYSAVLARASESLCGPTPPAAPFRSLFADAEATVARVTTGATTAADLYPGDPDVGLYYTPSGPRGLGTVTGPAATVTMMGELATADLDPATTMTAEAGGAPTSTGEADATEASRSGSARVAGCRWLLACLTAVVLARHSSLPSFVLRGTI